MVMHTASVHSASSTFAKKLASNDSKIRKKGLKTIRKWLKSQSSTGTALDEEELLRLWKGIFYSFWMSDKALYQEELAEAISNLIFEFENLESALSFLDSFFKTMSREWFSIDKFRIEKFMMLVRVMLQKTFKRIFALKPKDRMAGICKMNKTLMATVLGANNSQNCPTSLKVHVADIYLYEIKFVSNGKLKEKFLRKLIRPFCVILAKSKCKTHVVAVKNSVFNVIMDTTVYRGMEAKQESGQFSDEEELGYVEIYTRGLGPSQLKNIADLKFDCNAIASILKKLAQKSCAKNRKMCFNIVKKLQKVAVGQASLFTKFPIYSYDNTEQKVAFDNAVENLIKDSEENKNRKRKASENETKINKKKRKIKSVICDEIEDLSNVSPVDVPSENVHNTSVPDVVKSSVKSRKKKKGAPTNLEDLVDNGISIDLNESKISPKVKGKRKKQALSNLVEVSSTKPDDDVTVECKESETTPKGQNKKKKKELSNLIEEFQAKTDNDNIALDYTESEVSPKSKNKKMKQELRDLAQVSPTKTDCNGNDVEDSEEIEIIIPNKKYKGKQKLVPSAQENKMLTSPFASFDKLKKTPPAFVRKAVKKFNSATVPTKKKEKVTRLCQTPGSSRRVNFVLARNKLHEHSDYVKDIQNSPSLPFSAGKKPDQGVLKSTPVLRQRKERLKAADFF